MKATDIEERVARIEAIMLDLVEGRIRTDFIIQEMERRGLIPMDVREMAAELMDRHRMKTDRKVCQKAIKQGPSDGVMFMRYGERASKIDRSLAESDQKILKLAQQMGDGSHEG